jgi:hypothetical protein
MTTNEQPRYFLHRDIIGPAGGLLEKGSTIEFAATPNAAMQPLSPSARERIIAAGLNPDAFAASTPEALVRART